MRLLIGCAGVRTLYAICAFLTVGCEAFVALQILSNATAAAFELYTLAVSAT